MITELEKKALADLKKIVEENNTITISTVSKGGNLWSTKTYYGEDNGYIYVCIEDGGRAFANIKENPRIFFVIEKNDPFRFVQGEGVVEIIGPSEEHPIERSYYLRKNFPAVGFLRLVKTHVIRIRPTVVYVSNFSEGWRPRTEVILDEEKFNYLQSLYSKKTSLRAYIQATRPWVIGITISAVIIGTLLAVLHKKGEISIGMFILTMLGAVFAHLGVNAWSDFFDYKKGADKWFTLGSSRTIVDYLLRPSTVLSIGIVFLVLAGIIGGVIYFIIGKPLELIYLIGIGGILGLFYCFIPFGWKYLGLGDIAVFLAWSLMCVGAYFIQTREFSLLPGVAFFPVAILVVGILHANNMRDIKDDILSGYRTFAGLLGLKGSQFYYAFLIIISYISLIFGVVKGYLPVWALLCLFSIYYALKNVKFALRPNFLQFNMLDYLTAQLANKVALFLIIGFIIEILLTYGK